MFAVWAACNRDRDLADEPHWCSSVFGCRKACGLARIEIGYHDVVTAEKSCTFIAHLDKVFSMQAARVLILSGPFKGEEGICLGKDRNGRCAVSPDQSDELLSLTPDSEFALLVDLAVDPRRN